MTIERAAQSGIAALHARSWIAFRFRLRYHATDLSVRGCWKRSTACRMKRCCIWSPPSLDRWLDRRIDQAKISS